MSEQLKQRVESAGFDWSKIWPILQKFGPMLQQIIIELLNQNNSAPNVAMAGNVVNDAQVSAIANAYGIDLSAFKQFLATLKPYLVQILLAILSNTVVQQSHNG